ncbi:hypothetical protein J2Z79_001195 [Symbiobacterium terraclitae]|uniref:ATPase n=1 Tax=Symbiobacterium terraclitae TaxID=557451 RepID=A0ABS4JQK4_9FIRM|nr:hypothetical protein [Symbiobacterium terraclitae]MBP2017810.1 hypothetical protein [Symbiobacterium terraclitae]
MASVQMLPVDWEKVTVANNPFMGPGSAVCDPSSPKEDLNRYVKVGIVKNVTNLVTKCMATGVVQHFLLLAPFGYGKSRSFAAAMAIAKANNAMTLYVKFSNYRTEEAVDVILGNLCKELFNQACAISGESPVVLRKKLVGNADPMSLSPLEFLPNLSKALGSKWLLVFLDEIEKVLEAEGLSIDHKINILNVFKHWAEYGKEGYVLGLAGTGSVQQWLTTAAPEFIDRFELLRDEGLSPTETVQYIRETCEKVLGPGKEIISDSVVTSLHRIARGIPRLLESIAHECWNWAAGTKKVLDAHQFRLMVSEVYGLALKETCRAHEFSDEQMEIILKLLQFGGTARLRDLVSPDDLQTYRTHGKWLLSLAKKSDSRVVERSKRGVYTISDEFMMEIIRRKLARRGGK